ncbi:MAG: GntR family transcriptional regulator [Sphaerochaetaceae bacterium]|nr:GntR family transcriptional regulator [Sphaerochaetaceae bacterium]
MNELFTVAERRLSSVEIVVEKIKELLIRQSLKPGDMIPSETVLAENLKVGRGSVREAIKILSAYGVLEIRRGSGTFVATASNKKLFDAHLYQILVQERDYESLTQVRQLLEEGIVRLVIEHASDEDLKVLDRTMNSFLKELRSDQVSFEKANEYDIEYHHQLGNLTHNPIIERIYDFVIELFTPTINPIHAGVYEAHESLHNAVMNRNIDEAILCVHTHTDIWVQSHLDKF